MRIHRWIALVLAVGLVLGACTSTEPSGTESTEADGTSPSTSVVESTAPGEGQGDDISSRPSIVLGPLNPEPPDLLPGDLHGRKNSVFMAMLPPVIRAGSEAEFQSDLLESWEISDEATTVTLTVGPGIEWSDGTPLTSSDIVMSLSYYLDPAIASPAGQFIGGVVGQSVFDDSDADAIEGLSAPDERTAVIELENPDPTWLRKLAWTQTLPILPAHILGDVPHSEWENHDYFQDFPVVSGPYRLVEWVQGQHIEMERNDAWSLGEAGFDRVFFAFVDADQAAAQFETGDMQMLAGIDTNEADRIGSLDNVEITAHPLPSIETWAFAMNQPLLQDVRVRQAMVYAVDREAICQAAYNGYCSVPDTHVPHLGNEWAMPADAIEYAYDPELARQLLDEANWDPSTELVFLDNVTPDSPQGRAHAIAQANLAEVGVNWRIETLEPVTFDERRDTEVPNYTFHGLRAFGQNMVVDPDYVNPLLSCDSRYPDGSNFGLYCNEELDQFLSAGRTEGDPEVRAEIYQDAFRIIAEDVPGIYLFVPDYIVAQDSSLKGVEGLISHGPHANIGEWYWEE